MGGTIYRHSLSGDKVFAMSLTDGVGSRESQEICASAERLNAANQASDELKFEWLCGENFPDNGMDTIGVLEIAKRIEAAKLAVKPNLIYTHSYADLNVDHQITCKAVLTAFRPQPGEIFEEIRTFEVPSSTDYGHNSVTGAYNPNLFVDISSAWHKKVLALKYYQQEMRDSPHSRSFDGLENLAKLRGNQCGVKYAESFEIIRRIER
jgi:LmbE family N-acetylglucosaminyl deacetylase